MLNRISVATILLVALASPLLVGFVTTKIELAMVRKEVKHQMMAGISKEKLTLISTTPATANQLDWEHSREFAYQQEMYDVVYTEVMGDTTHYWCWKDDKESRLNQELARLLHQDSRQERQHKRSAQLLVLYKSLYYQKSDRFKLHCFKPNHSNTATQDQRAYLSPIRPIDTPPPQVQHT
ncbi:hypothetical protein [Marinoscillum sp.]|uniref:hypothetical protein n=1 Tax=Marinoscillum sp. TaxID=2024838 RepID=UPI003BAC46F3